MASFMDDSTQEVQADPKKYPDHVIALSFVRNYQSITRFVVNYNLNSRKFDIVKKQGDFCIPEDFYKDILPKLQASLNSSKYCDAKSTDISRWWYLAWAVYILLIMLGGLILLIYLELLFLLGALIIYTALLGMVPYFVAQICKCKGCLNVHKYMIKRQYQLGIILREDFGEKSMLKSDSTGNIYSFQIGMYGSFIIVDMVSTYEKVCLQNNEVCMKKQNKETRKKSLKTSVIYKQNAKDVKIDENTKQFAQNNSVAMGVPVTAESKPYIYNIDLNLPN